MAFKKFMSAFVTDDPVADVHQLANRIALDEQFPTTGDHETLLNYVRTQAKWREPGSINEFKKVYAMYASVFDLDMEWQHSLDFIESNSPEHFNTLTASEKEILLNWIQDNLEPFRTKGYHSIRNSYRLKHNFEFSEEGFYISNGQFKGAMLACGFKPKDYDALNWYFTLSKNAGISVT